MPIWTTKTISTCPHCNEPEREVIEVKTRRTIVKACNVCNPELHLEVERFFQKGKKATEGEETREQKYCANG
jgi:transcription elongation factor Elf1